MSGTDVISNHTRKYSLNVSENVPKHEPRGEFNDDFYQKSRDKVLKKADGCYICGRTEEDLKNDDGYGRYLETHHKDCEWAWWNKANPDLMRKAYDATANGENLVLDPYGMCVELQGQKVSHPGDPRNLLVLCPRHHRYSPDPGKGGGIHNMPDPEWEFQRFKLQDFQLFGKSDN